MAKVAFIVGEDFEDREFREPFDAVQKAGHEAKVIGTEKGKKLKGKKGKEEIIADVAIDEVSPDEFDALVIPGGYSPDHLRTHGGMVDFVREMVESEKPVAVICHGPSMLVEADVLEGRTVTSWPSVKTDLINAGAQWVDREVVEDGNLITSRKPDDLPAFNGKLLEHLEKGPTEEATTRYAEVTQTPPSPH